MTGDNDAQRAEQARLEREGIIATPTMLHVRVIGETAIAVGDGVAPPGETFVAPEPAVRNAVARGLLEVVSDAV